MLLEENGCYTVIEIRCWGYIEQRNLLFSMSIMFRFSFAATATTFYEAGRRPTAATGASNKEDLHTARTSCEVLTERSN